MTIDYGKIVTNALSLVVAGVFASAAAIVWNGATTIDGKIDAAQAEITASVTTLVGEVAELKATIAALEREVKQTAVRTNRPVPVLRRDSGYLENQRVRIQQDIRAKTEAAK